MVILFICEMKKTFQYYIDKVKQSFYFRLSGENKKLKTGMQCILLILKSRNLLPKNLRALELFGMHGLWHTMDYIDLVDHLDIFEIDNTYSDFSKRNLPQSKVDFYSEDSIVWLSKTTNSYNFVVADIPFSGPFYTEQGTPKFFSDLLKVTESKGVLIFNSHTELLATENFKHHILELVGADRVKDLFFIPKNTFITYTVLILN